MVKRSHSIWHRPRLKRHLNHGSLYVITVMHVALDLMPWLIRNALWKLLLRRCGSGVFFDAKVYVKFPWLVSIGSDTSINRGAEFYCSLRHRSQIVIGSNVRIAPNVRLHAAGHDPDDPSLADTGATIRIDDDVWIGAGAIVLQGVHIHRGAVIAAGSVVNRDVAAHTIAAGVPARAIRQRRGFDAST